MPFDVTIRRTFSAAHALRWPDGSTESLHGHDWSVTVTVAAETLDESGLVMDFHDLEAQLDALLTTWHNRNLNDLPPFDSARNPSAERVAQTVAEALDLPPRVKLARVEVGEAPGCTAGYEP